MVQKSNCLPLLAFKKGKIMLDNIPRTDIDFTKVAEMGNGLLPLLNSLREEAPVIWSDVLHGWLVTRHADVLAGFDLKLPLSNDRFPADYFDCIPRAEHETRIPILRTTADWIVGIDPPRHTHVRSLARKAFSKKIVDDIKPYAVSVIDRVLTEAGERDEVDFVEDVAVAITGRVMARLLGVPEKYVTNLRRWSWDLNVALGPARNPEVLDGAERSLQEMKQILEVEVAERRRAPREDFLSQLVNARDAGTGLTDEELLGVCYVTLSAGHDTTAHSMTLGFKALVEHPEARQYLLDHPERINDSVGEVMRYVAMSTTQPRVAAQDFEWHGQHIAKGDFVYLMIAAANRDPSVFPNPEVLDLSRATDRSMVFGSGIHHCIGHLLAKMQLGSFFPEAFRRYPNARVLEQELQWQPSLAFRGVEHLAVSFK
jgi:cytochrome P450